MPQVNVNGFHLQLLTSSMVTVFISLNEEDNFKDFFD